MNSSLATSQKIQVLPSDQALALVPREAGRFTAIVTVETRQGKVTLTATADQDFVATEAVRRGATQIMLPKNVVAAKGFIQRLRDQDEGAWHTFRHLMSLASAGNPKALEALKLLKSTYRLDKTPSATAVTSGVLGDTSKRGLATLIALARKGNPKAKAMLAKLMGQQKAATQAARPTAAGYGSPKTGYYPFPQSSRAGIEFGASVRRLPPARINQLKALILAARHSAPTQLMARVLR
jgi:hypothetical protein